MLLIQWEYWNYEKQNLYHDYFELHPKSSCEPLSPFSDRPIEHGFLSELKEIRSCFEVVFCSDCVFHTEFNSINSLIVGIKSVYKFKLHGSKIQRIVNTNNDHIDSVHTINKKYLSDLRETWILGGVELPLP